MVKAARVIILLSCLLCVSPQVRCQDIHDFLTPSDTLNIARRNGVMITQGSLYAGALVGLHQLWYKDYAKSSFQFINDNDHWLQMDKAGHVFSTYHLSKLGYDAFRWSGASDRSSLYWGVGTSLLFMTTIELMDAHSAEWGFSWGDFAANMSGAALFSLQQWGWGEQRIKPKFSFHTTPYASLRPDALGSSVGEQIFKDYNGQTYWLSVNPHAFLKNDSFPKWLNVAFGYGATGMISARNQLVNSVFFPDRPQTRQYFLSLDIDLEKIPTDSSLLKTLFSVVNIIKLPAPTFEIRGDGQAKFHWIYF
jgi:uncharacterized protein YfiM (DUF2279 family)